MPRVHISVHRRPAHHSIAADQSRLPRAATGRDGYLEAGQPAAQIDKRLSLHHTTVVRHLKQAGETLRTNSADPTFQERVRQVYAEIGMVKHTAAIGCQQGYGAEGGAGR